MPLSLQVLGSRKHMQMKILTERGENEIIFKKAKAWFKVKKKKKGFFGREEFSDKRAN